ncbi:MAG: Rpn family recombination-promoting nuclease/putative transposase [bacterium]|nr:Rpn family recombination-promoting nuclease/putative transposase [bacterium]
MKNTTTDITDIRQINDMFFHKIFDSPANARDFLERVLPDGLKKQLDLTDIKIENTKYVSNQFKKGYSDIVVKTSMKTKTDKKKPVDIYFILEHKSEGKVEVLIQILKYMAFEWEKDYNNNKPPRVIIPVVFYHGAAAWKVPRSFADQFDVDDEVKRFLLDYRYVLFDTNDWDFSDESNSKLKENVFLFSSMVLMKAAFKNDMETVREILKFWHEKGFTGNKEILMFFLVYIAKTQEINLDKFNEMLEEIKIDGGDIMQTLAQQLEKKGKKEGKLETARELIKRGVDINLVADVTGFPREELEKLSATVH